MSSMAELAYRSVSSSSSAPSLSPLSSPPITGTMKVIAGAEPNSQRTWILAKALLARCSMFFASVIREDPKKAEVELAAVDGRDFQNFVDYLYSGIYSLNTQVVEYRAITANAEACLLGARLGAKTYSDAALRNLFSIFEPLAKSRSSNAKQCLLRASDIEFICLQTGANTNLNDSFNGNDNDDEGKRIKLGLRNLFFDALTSHWTQHDVLAVRILENDTPGDITAWARIYNKNPAFRANLRNSLMIADVWRAKLLRPIDEYFYPAKEEEEEDEPLIKREDGEEHVSGMRYSPARMDLHGVMGERITGINQPRPRAMIPSLRRMNSDRARRERVDDQGQEDNRRGVKRESDGGIRGEEAEAVGEMEDGELDELEQYEDAEDGDEDVEMKMGAELERYE
ncbi:hypothetical protein EJ02DRAFT_449163 [Clathrospora elynae]|uniref:BTB domain-containing protein n=1 Tax=Clathrospora elynae TaxID=706981 RepID=A0A6A5T675_9PLEO|nr:hypothetical protein EJ02DRAFT_449163 [Clathrospora elynae]